MGSTISKYYDDMDDYIYLCKKFNVESESTHNCKWLNHFHYLEKLNEGKTILSYEKYKAKELINSFTKSIKDTEDLLQRYKESLEENIKKFNSL